MRALKFSNLIFKTWMIIVSKSRDRTCMRWYIGLISDCISEHLCISTVMRLFMSVIAFEELSIVISSREKGLDKLTSVLT